MISPIKIIGSIVYKTREALRANQDFIDGLSGNPFYLNFFKEGLFSLWHFPGTPNELSESFLEIGKGVDGSKDKFPALFNFMPVEQNYSRVNGDNRTSFIYNLAFVGQTLSKWPTEVREELVFDPLLRPMCDEFFNQLYQSRYFDTDFGFIQHRRYEVFTTGNKMDERIQGRYGDYLDAIEIHKLQLILKPLCKKDLKQIEEENLLIV